ncbi:MAG: gamma-glutamyltransferase, partial [Dehalococcoidia bacterium]
ATYAGDPDTTGFDAQRLLESTHLGSLLAHPAPAAAGDGDTTYLLVIDAEGNAVSLIQSIFAGWGSGVLVPGTGVIMNNRMFGFTLREGHPNVLAPGKRPMHTLHSYIATCAEGKLRVVGGTPGAMQQPQTNLAVLDAILRQGMDVQDALDRPRWSMGAFAPFRPDYREVLVERHSPDGFSPAFRDAEVDVEVCDSWTASMGRAYVAAVDDAGIAVGADVRGEGLAIVM